MQSPTQSTYLTRAVGRGTVISEPALTQHHHPKPSVYIRVHSWWIVLYGFGRMYKALYHHCVTTQSSLAALKKPLCSVYSSLPLCRPLATHDPFNASIILPFPECHIVELIQYAAFTAGLLSLSNMHLSFVAQLVKNLPTMQETRVRFLSWEDLLEKEMATHSSILAWRIPWTDKPGRLLSMGS